MNLRDIFTGTETGTVGRGNGARRGLGIADLIKELRDETTLLLRQEVELAKTEMTEKATKAGRNVGYLTAGAAIAAVGGLFLLLGINYLLVWGLTAAGVPAEHSLWIAPMIVGAVVAIIGAVLVVKALNTLKHTEEFVPQQTMDSLQENKRWVRQKVA